MNAVFTFSDLMSALEMEKFGVLQHAITGMYLLFQSTWPSYISCHLLAHAWKHWSVVLQELR